MVVGCRCRTVEHHTMNRLRTSLDTGHGAEDLWKASKHAKACIAELYFPQVDFATEELMRWVKPAAVADIPLEAVRPRAPSASARCCMEKRVLVSYFASRGLAPMDGGKMLGMLLGVCVQVVLLWSEH